jgi:hypothetical protein
MVLTRLYSVLLLLAMLVPAAAIGLGKSPGDSSTVCERYQRSDLIFTGSAETGWITALDTRKSPIHKRSEKSKRVRFLVREWYKGQRQNTVEVWMTPGDCALTIEPNQTYLVYAHLNKDNGRTESNACLGTVAAGTASSDLTYLTAAQHGPAQATRLSGNAGGPGVNIQAKSGIDTRYAIADAAGLYTFDGLATGDWAVSVVGGAGKSVQLTPNSCVTLDLAAQ